jgi:hypothetical protein
MLLIAHAAIYSPSSFVGTWLKRGVDFGKDASPSYFFTVGGIGASALSIAVTSLLLILRESKYLSMISESLDQYLTTSRAIAFGTFATLFVYLNMWYAGNMAKRIGASRIATNVAFFVSLGIAGYVVFTDYTEETALNMVKGFNNFFVPWSIAHYLYPELLQYTFSIKVSEGEAILVRAACSFTISNNILHASLARGTNTVQAMSHMAFVMLLSSLDFQIRFNPKWGMGNTPKGIEIDWSRVNGWRTWSILFGVLYYFS